MITSRIKPSASFPRKPPDDMFLLRHREAKLKGHVQTLAAMDAQTEGRYRAASQARPDRQDASEPEQQRHQQDPGTGGARHASMAQQGRKGERASDDPGKKRAGHHAAVRGLQRTDGLVWLVKSSGASALTA